MENHAPLVSAILPDAQNQKITGDEAAAKYLGICRVTLSRLKKSGKVSYWKIGRKYVYTKYQLDNLFFVPVKGGQK